MFHDRYGLPLTTRSAAARDHYIDGVDRLLAAGAGADTAFAEAARADEGFAMAHIGEARAQQMFGRGDKARAALARARACAGGVTPREAAHVQAFGDLIEGRSGAGYRLIREHLHEHPRDVMLAQTCMGVFSLIGFSGQPGREAEALAVAEMLAPAYGDDWWMLGQLGFARLESGRLDPALPVLDRSLELNPDNANAAHYRAHLYYEVGDTHAGLDFLTEWARGFDRAALLHCHCSWHIALWALATGDIDRMWRVIDSDLLPGTSQSPPLNVLTDLAALYYRAGLAGVVVPAERWRSLSHYARQAFPEPGFGFADVHAALAHAMAGESEALQRIATDAAGPAADLVVRCANGFGAMARQDWTGALDELSLVMSDHARLGGSRAQRDLLEFALAWVLMRLGRGEEARRQMVMRRPVIDLDQVIKPV